MGASASWRVAGPRVAGLREGGRSRPCSARWTAGCRGSGAPALSLVDAMSRQGVRGSERRPRPGGFSPISFRRTRTASGTRPSLRSPRPRRLRTPRSRRGCRPSARRLATSQGDGFPLGDRQYARLEAVSRAQVDVHVQDLLELPLQRRARTGRCLERGPRAGPRRCLVGPRPGPRCRTPGGCLRRDSRRLRSAPPDAGAGAGRGECPEAHGRQVRGLQPGREALTAAPTSRLSVLSAGSRRPDS